VPLRRLGVVLRQQPAPHDVSGELRWGLCAGDCTTGDAAVSVCSDNEVAAVAAAFSVRGPGGIAVLSDRSDDDTITQFDLRRYSREVAKPRVQLRPRERVLPAPGDIDAERGAR